MSKSVIPHTLDNAVTDWVIDYPKTEAVFQSMGIDYSCGGKSLKYACEERGHDAQNVLSILHNVIEQSTNAGNARR